MNKILWVSVVNIYKVDDLEALECFCYISQGKKKKGEGVEVKLVERLLFYVHRCLPY